MPDAHKFDRRSTDANVAALAVRVNAFESWAERLEVEVKSNTRLTEEVHGNTAEIVELFKASKDFFEFTARWGKRVAIFAKYVSYIAGAIAAVWAVLNLRR